MARWLVIGLVAVLVLGTACGDDSPDEDSEVPDLDDDSSDDDAGDDDDDDSEQTGTKYPIVLAHGFFGWGDVGPVDYFYRVKETLEGLGYTVIEPNVTAIGTTPERAVELAAIVDEAFPGQRVNIIAHSQGGLDARYLISTLGWGDRVASLTTISAPHHGSGLADVIAGVLPDFGEEIIDRILEILGWDWDVIEELQPENIENNFNPANPDWPGVKYYSYYGDAAGNVCNALSFTYDVLLLVEGCSDGVIGCESAVWGEFLGVMPADHWAEIGQLAGLTDYDWLTFYVNLAAFLKEQGF